MAQKYRYSRKSSPFDDAKQMYIIIGACALAVIIGLVLLLTLQSSCGEQEIPVVEQGDGPEEQLPGLPGNDIVTSMGDIIIDDGGAPVTEFEVIVEGADGIYKRTGQDAPEYTLTVTGQNAESFSFELALSDVTVEGVAYFNGETTAICEKADGIISFAFDGDVVNVTADETVSELGGLDADGLYLLSEAITTTSTESTTTAATSTTTAPPPSSGKYDLDSINSDAVQSTLDSMMSAEHRKLLSDLIKASGGYGQIYGTGDASKEAQGRSFNLDRQMNGVMYYANEPGAGREVVVICGDNGRLVYVGICDGAEYRYYSNDPERKSAADAPRTIVLYANNSGMTLEG
ncbi:MAG: hypothetical protein E7554_05760 [Ruminococcaceae bacterium]|nr:hypothetical protein [Oscillospiraceae bacterium]